MGGREVMVGGESGCFYVFSINFDSHANRVKKEGRGGWVNGMTGQPTGGRVWVRATSWRGRSWWMEGCDERGVGS